jgi:hypothetical protein
VGKGWPFICYVLHRVVHRLATRLETPKVLMSAWGEGETPVGESSYHILKHCAGRYYMHGLPAYGPCSKERKEEIEWRGESY